MTTDTKLLAAQARIKVLREAGERCRKEMERRGLLGEANFILREMDIPGDTAELDALVNLSSRSKTLLEAAKYLLTQCNESHYVLSAISEVPIPYDGTECDGACLLDDITLHLEDIDAMKEETP